MMYPGSSVMTGVRPSSILLLALLIGEAVAFGQIGGQYPGGQYPGGQNPSGNRLPGAGLPFPGRKKKSTTTSKDTTPEQFIYVNGMFRSLDEKQIVLQAEDTRILNVKVSAATKYLKAGEDIKSADLKPGDHLEIEATQDTEGFYHAVNVIVEKEGTAAERAKAAREVSVSTQASSNSDKDSDDERPRLRRADSPPPAEAAAEPEPATAATPAVEARAVERIPDGPLAPAAADPDDPGPPTLRRGVPTKRPQTAPKEIASARLPTSAPAPGRVETPAPAARESEPTQTPETQAPEVKPEDPLIEKAREMVESFSETLPNYICQQFTARFINTAHITSWQAQDVVSAEVIYENGRESYRNLAINGKAVKKNMEELSGAWSTGEFGTLQRDLFSRSSAAEFRLRRDSATIAGMSAAIYNFEVKRENSHWRVQAPSQSVFPAYKGSVWIDKKNGRVLRIESQARSVPSEFPFDTIESSADYEYVRIGGTQQFLLPVHSETLMCQRGTNTCSKNTIDFRNYKKYSGESSITFDK